MLPELQLKLAALDADVDLQKAQISLLRQAGLLSARLKPQQSAPTP